MGTTSCRLHRVLLSMTAVLLAVASAVSARGQEGDPAERRDMPPSGWAGLIVKPVAPELAAQLADVLTSGTGVVVTHVVPDSPADAAELKPFDVIARCGGSAVGGESQLRERIAATPPGERIPFEIVRAAKPLDVELTTALRPEIVTAGRMAKTAVRTNSPDQLRTGGAEAEGHRPVRTRGVTMSTDDGTTYELSAVSVDASGRFEQSQISGELSGLARHVDELPEELREAALASVSRAAEFTPKGPGVRCRLQPRVDSRDATVRVVISRTGKGGERRTFEMEHAVDPERDLLGEDLLQVGLLAEELQRLSPSIRAELEGALRRLRIPKVQAEVQNSL